MKPYLGHFAYLILLLSFLAVALIYFSTNQMWYQVVAIALLIIVILSSGGLFFIISRKREAYIAEIERKNSLLAREIEEHRLAEENLRLTLHSIGDAVIVTDADGCVARMNPAAEQLSGWTFADAQNCHLDEILRLINAQTRQPIINPVARVIQEGKAVGLANHTVLIRRDGDERQIADSAAPIFSSDGSINGVVMVFRDVTETYRMQQEVQAREAKLFSIFRAAPVGIGVVVSRIFAEVNDTLCAMTGYSRDDLLGQSARMLYPTQEDYEYVGQAKYDQIRQRGTGMVETRWQCKDGSIIYIMLSSTPINPQDWAAGVTFTALDITEQKMAQAELRQLTTELEQRVQERTRQLEDANKELEAFSYSVSHDLRSPCRAVDGFSRLLMEDFADDLPEDAQNYIGRVRAAAQHMGQLIDDLLNMSRLSRAHIGRTEVNMSQMAQQIAADLCESQPDRSVEWVIAPGVIVSADFNLIRIVLDNLLRNAWKFTRQQPRAHIEFGCLQQEDKPIYFVRDNGAGFEMTYADKLFRPFQRLHSPGEFEGTGIGLSIVQRIIHRHGGRVWAEGVPEQGATFYFTLPGKEL